jgi:hypothetical protein
MASYAQQQQQVQRALVEERHYRVPYQEGSGLIQRALGHALGVEFEELAPGMWFASKKADEHSFLEVTVRTLEVDDGTSVEIHLEHRSTPKAVALFVLGIALGCVIILPLIPTILIAHRLSKRHQRQRLVEMHRAWTEIGHAVGAPRKSTYRDQPRHAYAPLRFARPSGDEQQRERDAVDEAERQEDAEPVVASTQRTAAP